jgi:hypothetical protein
MGWLRRGSQGGVGSLPQETATARRSDFPMRARTQDCGEWIVLLDMQSRSEAEVPLRLLEYEASYRFRCKEAVLEHCPAFFTGSG